MSAPPPSNVEVRVRPFFRWLPFASFLLLAAGNVLRMVDSPPELRAVWLTFAAIGLCLAILAVVFRTQVMFRYDAKDGVLRAPGFRGGWTRVFPAARQGDRLIVVGRRVASYESATGKYWVIPFRRMVAVKADWDALLQAIAQRNQLERLP